MYLKLVSFSTIFFTSEFDKCCNTCLNKTQSAEGKSAVAISKHLNSKLSALKVSLLCSIKFDTISTAT